MTATQTTTRYTEVVLTKAEFLKVVDAHDPDTIEVYHSSQPDKKLVGFALEDGLKVLCYVDKDDALNI